MTDDNNDDDNDDDADERMVTQADLDEAKARWADPKYQPAVRELFARAVTGNGLRGDVLIGEDESDGDTTGS